MSVIQKIQEKYAKLMAIIIAVALMIFVVMLAFENGGTLFRGDSSRAVGKVNGTSIEFPEFADKVERTQKAIEQQQYYGTGLLVKQRALENVWEQEIYNVLLDDEADKLGMKVGKNELGDVLYGPNGPQQLKSSFTDSATGQYDGRAARMRVNEILNLKKGTLEQLQTRESLIELINGSKKQRLNEKYSSLFSNSVNSPKWFVEKQNADNNQMARISFVRESYASAIDSTMKITDKEIEEYVSKHKKEFKQFEKETRDIAYVSFSALPSASDSTSARNKVVEIKAAFDSAKDTKKFLEDQGINTYNDSYLGGKLIQVPAKDSIFKTPVGQVYGPYLDGNSFSLAKVLAVRNQSDSVKVRHILIQTDKFDQQTRQWSAVRDSVTAKRMVDSVQRLLANGANFDTLCLQISDDEGKFDRNTQKFTGGIYSIASDGQWVPEFSNYAFGNPTGAKGIVKTVFGYHYMEVMSHMGAESPAYKIAYISKPIETSQDTYNSANNAASQFAGDSRDIKAFDANYEKIKTKEGVSRNTAVDLEPLSYQVPGLAADRDFIKNIFSAKTGEVLEPQKVGEFYVVAIVTHANKEGNLSLAKARVQVEPILKKRKAAEKLKQKLGTVTTLEAAATAWGGKPVETADSLYMATKTGPMFGDVKGEPSVVGAAFNPSNKGKVVTQMIEGSEAVYVVRVDGVTTIPVTDTNNVADQRKIRYIQGKQADSGPSAITALKESASIKDKRSDFF